MHPALFIQEFLLVIFGHCFPPGEWKATTDLAALTRTCRAFKDPALDILWKEPYDPSPLVRCLPEVSHRLSARNGDFKCYSFRRIPTRNEWGIIRSYTRRIRSINKLFGIDRLSLRRLWKAPTPLFQALHQLNIEYERRAVRLFFVPLSFLVSFTVKAETLRLLERSLISLPQTPSNLRELLLPFHELVNMGSFDSSFICQWRHLRTVVCPQILDVTTLVHLSFISSLTRLEFKLSSTVPDQISSLKSHIVFSYLEDFTLHFEFLDPISCLLPHVRYPVIKAFHTSVEHRPSMQEISSFVASAQKSGLCRIVQKLSFCPACLRSPAYSLADRPVLGFLYLEPFMTFNGLRCINFNVECTMDLTDSELLTFVSGLPRLEELGINKEWGWNTGAGIMPNGLIQILHEHSSLTSIALAFDTLASTTIPPSIVLTSRLKSIGVVDSIIKEGSMAAMAAFFTRIIVPDPFMFLFWKGRGARMLPGYFVCAWGVYIERSNRNLLGYVTDVKFSLVDPRRFITV